MEKAIVLKNSKGEVVSQITTMTNVAALKSNITAAGFTEMYKMKDASIYTDLAGSIRATANAMIIGESIVSPKNHIFHKLYQTAITGKDQLICFQYYHSQHHNPEMTPEELNSYRNQFLPHEYDQNFLNTWESARGSFLTLESIKEMGLVGIDARIGNRDAVKAALKRIENLKLTRDNSISKGNDVESIINEITTLESRLLKIDSIYQLPASRESLKKLEENFNISEWIITGGMDRAKPYDPEQYQSQAALKKRSRTIWTLMAKGLINGGGIRRFLYFLLDLRVINNSSEDSIKHIVNDATAEFTFLDNITFEDYETRSLHNYCQNQGLTSECVSPTYAYQRQGFLSVYNLIENGQLKMPAIPYYVIEGEVFEGFSDKPDILNEELLVFQHDADRSWFGSPEKKMTHGIKDDCAYSLCASIYSGRELFDGQKRDTGSDIGGFFIPNPDNLADYSLKGKADKLKEFSAKGFQDPDRFSVW